MYKTNDYRWVKYGINTLELKLKENRMPGKETRSKFIQIRVTEKEYAEIEEKAKALILTISDYMRMVAILADVNVEMDFKE